MALFGGTFDPLHVGHLAAAHAALGSGLVDEVIFIPGGTPPHKPAGATASAEDRWLMAVLATLDEPRFRVARWEVDRAEAGRTFAVDTLRLAHADLGLPAGARPFWIIGADAMALIHTWHDVPALFGLAKFMVVARDVASWSEGSLRACLALSVPHMPLDTLAYVAMPPVDVSSTALRAILAAGGEPPASLPAPIATYIQRYRLYRPKVPK